ncbi:response regulator transcription factor [Mycolicibacterium sp. CH28]|uniref:response regulator transcription factor n=1 Tax=Mycolicibacterium sp. CH28 TaxID=2512237 RepID=UPI001080A202|nr:response regulator transcription factor [Mycolicibacterium sp. CH28]TGD85493.1 response regulator transcription factor [Mycolicibacterium sp. CH28]
MDNAGPTDAALNLRALVVDDELPLTKLVANYLSRESFEVHTVNEGAGALMLAREVDPDIVVLDVGLPGLDGFEICRQLRTFSDAYVIMLTARDTEVDTVVGLSVGADDYMTKPFSPRELVARIRAMLRRPRRAPSSGQQVEQTPPRVFGALRIDLTSREVHVDAIPITLTRTEFDLLATLSSRPGAVMSRRQLLESVWGDSWFGNDNIIDVHIGHLRRKLGDNPVQPRYVNTVRGIGYRMVNG